MTNHHSWCCGCEKTRADATDIFPLSGEGTRWAPLMGRRKLPRFIPEPGLQPPRPDRFLTIKNSKNSRMRLYSVLDELTSCLSWAMHDVFDFRSCQWKQSLSTGDCIFPFNFKLFKSNEDRIDRISRICVWFQKSATQTQIEIQKFKLRQVVSHRCHMW